MRERILELRGRGYSYNRIIEILGCSKSTVSYYIGKGQKEKHADRQKSRRKNDILRQRTERFKSTPAKGNPKPVPKADYAKRMRHKIEDFHRTTDGYDDRNFTLADVWKKIGDRPICHISGRDIDLSDPHAFAFDHIIPRSKGGDNSLENLGVATKEANLAKSNLTMEELLNLCSDILRHNGYSVTKSGE